MQTHAMQYGISYKYNQDFSGGNLTNFDMNLGMFLASRGPYAWLGCACLAPSMSVCHLVLDRACWWGRRVDGLRLRLGAQRQDAVRYLPPARQPRPGLRGPPGMCHEVEPNVFVREWTKSTVRVDCGNYTSSIRLK